MSSMLRDGACEIESVVEIHDWRDVDYELRSIAKRRAALDAEEAKWLREADRLRIWREVGCGSLLTVSSATAMAASAALPVVARHATSNSITSSIASTAASTRPRTWSSSATAITT